MVTTVAPVTDLQAAVDEEAEEIGFTGSVRVDVRGDTVIDTGYGLADRANEIPNTAATRFAMTSGSLRIQHSRSTTRQRKLQRRSWLGLT